MINTHTQANYVDLTFHDYELSINVKLAQIKEVADFIKLKTKGAPDTDLVLAVGDWNVNGRKMSEKLLNTF